MEILRSSIQPQSIAVTGSIVQTMSSREIAELTGKEHKHVKRDCDVMFSELEIDAAGYAQNWTHPQNGQTYVEYALTYELVQTLITGYSIKLRHAVIQRLNELEAQTVKPTQKRPRETPLITQVSRTFKSCMAMAKAMGLKGNQAVMSADHATKNITGESPMALLGVTQLVAPVQQKTFTPTQLGDELGVSGQKVNKLLAELGLQEKIGTEWISTTKGQQYSELIDTQKLHSNGSPIKQLRWYESTLTILASQIAKT